MEKNKAGRSLVECLGHLRGVASLDAGNQVGSRIREQLAEMAGLNKRLGYEVFSRCMPPSGERIVRLSTLLELLGYQIEERSSLALEAKRAGMLLALNLVTIQEMATKGKLQADTILRVLVGRNVCAENHKELFAKFDLQEKFDVALQSAQKKLEELGIGKIGESFTGEKKEVVPPSPLPSKHQKTIMEAVSLIKKLLPLAKLIASDECSPAEREYLRNQTREGNTHGVFELSNAFNALCGERARKTSERGIS